VHGKQDSTIPYQESEDFCRLSGAALVLVDGDHNFKKPQDAARMVAKVVEFCVGQ